MTNPSLTDAELSQYERMANDLGTDENQIYWYLVKRLIAALREARANPITYWIEQAALFQRERDEARAEIDLLRNNHTKSFEDLALEHHKLRREVEAMRVSAERWESFHADCTCGAATVHSSGKPRQEGAAVRLKREVEAMRGVVEDVVGAAEAYKDYVDHAGDFRNGVTDPNNSAIDEGVVIYAHFRAELVKALAEARKG